jgi:hypothetical protein
MRADFDGDGWFVMGTLDVNVAARFLRDNEPDAVKQITPRKGKASWMRTVPKCPAWCETQDHEVHLVEAHPKAHGAMEVVYFPLN